METNLVAMKRSNKDPETGNIFVVQPKEGVYYYGKVIEAKVQSNNPSFRGWYLVFIYDKRTTEKKAISLNGVQLLIAPMVVNKRPWTMGYFETVGMSAITGHDLSEDYGFLDIRPSDASRHVTRDLRGDLMSHRPRYLGIYGLSSYGAVAKEIHKALSDYRGR